LAICEHAGSLISTHLHLFGKVIDLFDRQVLISSHLTRLSGTGAIH